MSSELKKLPDGHTEVACYWEDESDLQASYLGILSRGENNEYVLTQYIGKNLACADSPCLDYGRHKVQRAITRNEAIIWLERELCFCESRGNSPYCKHRLSLNRSELRRLISGNRLEDYFYQAIGRLLLEPCDSEKGVKSGGPSLRKDIPHGRISFYLTPKQSRSQESGDNKNASEGDKECSKEQFTDSSATLKSEHSTGTKKPTPREIEELPEPPPNWRQKWIEDGKRWSRENNKPVPDHLKMPEDRKKPGPEVVRATILRETKEAPHPEGGAKMPENL